jgi:ABC-2 type transport system permease protein
MSTQSRSVELPSTPAGEFDAARWAGFAMPNRPGFWLPAISLWWREIVRFYRQRSRVAGVLGSPLIFWLVVGSGIGSSFRPDGAKSSGYLEYFFPGTIILIILFTSIFTMMSVIEDRKEGFLLSVLVSPASRGSLVMGKVLGGSTLALIQGMIFLFLAPTIGIHLSLYSVAMSAAILFIVSFGLTSLGFLIAWRLDSTHGFHALINLFLVPMWLVSGALFPISGASSWIGWIMRLNPLTYGMNVLRMLLTPQSQPAGAIGIGPSFLVSGIAAAIVFSLCYIQANRK